MKTKVRREFTLERTSVEKLKNLRDIVGCSQSEMLEILINNQWKTVTNK